jgi:hypothetical protein
MGASFEDEYFGIDFLRYVNSVFVEGERSVNDYTE